MISLHLISEVDEICKKLSDKTGVALSDSEQAALYDRLEEIYELYFAQVNKDKKQP